MPTENEPRCRCGAPVKQIDLYAGHFGQKSGPRFGWVHVDRDRNLNHQARLDCEALNDAD